MVNGTVERRHAHSSRKKYINVKPLSFLLLTPYWCINMTLRLRQSINFHNKICYLDAYLLLKIAYIFTPD